MATGHMTSQIEPTSRNQHTCGDLILSLFLKSQFVVSEGIHWKLPTQLQSNVVTEPKELFLRAVILATG